MGAPGLKALLAAVTLACVGMAAGYPGEGKRVWGATPDFNPVDETRLFAYGPFPSDFLWGVGSAAFQAEGGGKETGGGLSIWDHFALGQRSRLGNASAGPSGDSPVYLDKDLAALGTLGVTFYHFSMSWPRLFPGGVEGGASEKGVRYYNRLIDALLLRRVQPVVTLYHWDLPLAVQEKLGGWRSAAVVRLFRHYASFCFQEFGDRVKYWLTMHNPYLVAWHGYGTGLQAPGERGEAASVYAVGHNLIQAHAKVWHDYNTHFRPSQNGLLSLTLGSHWIEPEKGKVTPVNIEKCQQSMDAVLGWFAQPIHGDGDYPQSLKKNLHSLLPNFTDAEKNYIKGTADFFALSFGPNNFKPPSSVPKMEQQMSLNLREILNWIKLEYDSPRILITENGWFTNKNVKTEDTTVIYLMKKFINEVLQAIKYDDISVFGYTAWSLMDGFEWQDAYNNRRGLFYVDFNSTDKERIPKSSALFYQQIIRENGFPHEDSAPAVHGHFPCDFNWGITDSVLKAEVAASSPQFIDPHLYIWNISGDGTLYPVPGVKLKTRPAQCTDFVSVKKQLALLQSMKVTHYRFALNWSLILPNGDLSLISKEVLRYYRCMILEALKLNIKSMVTLYYPTHAHIGLPSPLRDAGGWLNQSTAWAFHDYAKLCFRELGDLVKLWITINEPNRLSHSYNESSNTTYQAAHNLLIAHALVWRTYDKQYRPTQHGNVGFSLHADWAEAANPYVQSHLKAAERFLLFEIAWLADPIFGNGDYPTVLREYIISKNQKGLSNSFLPHVTSEERALVKGAADFFAINHFSTRLVAHENKSGNRYESDRDSNLLLDITCLSSPSGLAVVPRGIRQVLNWIQNKYGTVTIYITANGIDDKSSSNDELRKYYLEKYTYEVYKAFQLDKINVKGYYAFTLSDRYKPQYGFFNSPLYSSKAKSSVEVYNALIARNGFPEDSAAPSCHLSEKKVQCTICSFLLQKKTLIFSGFCLLSIIILLLAILIIHSGKKTRRKQPQAKPSQPPYSFHACPKYMPN
uniref:Beta-klotho n=1 Tax=Geotrypetes seraphini TaxID=260995 RepID=A0A6P8RJB7_GEOSA|nr:beta-klotho [Geotrypetes seraphini]